jgi:hypothetical protein
LSLVARGTAAYSVRMRYFFHIVDKYGLCLDGTGYEHVDQEAAVVHARRIAAEIAKAGEFCRASFVLIVAAAPGPASRH